MRQTDVVVIEARDRVGGRLQNHDPRGVRARCRGGVHGDLGRALSSAVTAHLARHFGPKALEPSGYAEGNWDAEEWTRAAPASITRRAA